MSITLAKQNIWKVPILKNGSKKKHIWSISKLEDLVSVYPNYTFTESAFDDMMYWKQEDKTLYERLHVLLKDVEAHPFIGGLGKTEALKGTSGQASKRLDSEHRVQYSLQGAGAEKVITILRCKGHYT